MRQSILFPKTSKTISAEAQSINHQLLVRGGFIDQLMAGSWTLLPLGLKVVTKINNIIREELNKIGCQEVLMPLMHPKEIWNETGRWESASAVMYKLKDVREKELALSFTHEEIFLDLVRKHLKSYQDLPLALYQFTTKFRQELRAKAGILRGREFMMKDLYSLHVDEKDFWEFYEKVKIAYSNVFERIGFDFRVAESGGGVFTKNITHEFQVMAEGGEDTIYNCTNCDWSVNVEMFDPEAVKDALKTEAKEKCPKCGSDVKELRSIEVGNIFPYGTDYSEKMNVHFTDSEGNNQLPFFGSYGIGSTRVMGTWVETDGGHDERGIVWSKAISPFDVHLIELHGAKEVGELLQKLESAGIEVLWDDRGVGAGQKFAESDLIGIPFRLVVSGKTSDRIELKERTSQESTLVSSEELLNLLKN